MLCTGPGKRSISLTWPQRSGSLARKKLKELVTASASAHTATGEKREQIYQGHDRWLPEVQQLVRSLTVENVGLREEMESLRRRRAACTADDPVQENGGKLLEALVLSSPAAPPHQPLLRRRSLHAAPAPVPRVSAPLRATASAGRGAPLLRLVAAAAAAPGPAEPPAPPSTEEEVERAKLAQVSKRLEKTARYFRSLGTLGFWSQLVCTTVSAGILSFSAVATGNATSPFTFYATAVGIVAAFISVFWSFGYIRLSERLRRTANEPAKAPPRADVIKNLRKGVVLNVIGMGAAVLGMQATVGALVAKALTTSAVPYYQGISPGQSPVLALDVFLVQASANTILSHFLGLSSTLELLRSVTIPQTEAGPVPRPA